MRKIECFKAICIGALFAPFRKLFTPKPGIWLFGADKGEKYSQNSKYLFEYLIKNHPEINAFWVTRSKDVYKELRDKQIPVLFNTSLKGAYYSHKAELKILSTWFNDILYTFPEQKVAYLMHGMPAKKIYYDNIPKNAPIVSLTSRIRVRISNWFLYNFKLEDSCFTPVTSNYFKELMIHSMRNQNVFVTGQPRTDAFLHLDGNAIRKKYGINQNSFVITYMPTHRSYGRGEPSPHIFIENKEAISFFKENNIVVVWKQHINMLKKYQKCEADICFKEFSFDYSVDSQELLFISDVLITDFSSCFVDFMLLKRPILFYHYDDYEKNDNELYYGSELLEKIGSISKDEKKLFSDIKQVYLNKEDVTINPEWKLFNEFYDDKSCERSFEVLQEILKNE